MSLVAINLDRVTAGHLAVAIQLHRRVLDRHERPCPPSLIDLQHLATEVGKGANADSAGHLRTGADKTPDPDPTQTYGGPNGSELRNQQQVAEALGVSPRTVRRYLDSGRLRGVGPSRRISRHELHRFANPEEEHR